MRPGQDPFRDFLEGDGVALFDGAMGTMLYSKGVFIHRPFEEMNLTQPGLVREVLEEYVAAGADILETNTFAANRFRLSAHDLADQVSEINRRGVELAKEAAAGKAWVAGAMGPLGVRIEPFGHIGRDEARDVFAQQARALADASVDLFCLETFYHLPELVEAVHAVRQVSDLPIVAQIVVATGGVTREGVSASEVVSELTEAGADVVGVNCSEALAALDALAEMRRTATVPLCGQPNAGQPRSVAGRKLYMGSPEYLVTWARRAIRTGARLVGGCCGTTPEHIRALRSEVGDAEPGIPASHVALPRHRAPAAEAVPRHDKSILASTLAAGRFALGVELPPTRGWNGEALIDGARKLALAGVTFVALPEGSPDGAHLPPPALASTCREAVIEPLIHYSCRGRRLARMQSDLLGAYASGAANLLVVTGDPLTPGAEPDAWPDLEVDSIGAVNLAHRLNHGEDIGGNPIGRPAAFHIGVRLDATAWDREREIERFRWKVDAGAEFALTAPVFDPSALESILDELGPTIPVVATLWPLRSAREAEFFEQRLASVPVPEPFVERMRRAEAEGTESEEGLAIACELARAVRPLVQGVQVVAPGGHVDVALAVVDAARQAP
ncbi:MAG: bifunctional homocysteine S-methyltransferase/methylenetetrahydrofolate reductase [Myxococcota bacterium]